MTELFADPPLVEALCEIEFGPDSDWTWITPGRLYDRIKTEFPNTHSRFAGDLELSIGTQLRSQTTRMRSAYPVERAQMSRNDGSAMVQVGPNMLVVNHLLPYPGRDSFIELITEVLRKYLDVTDTTDISRVGLRYINQIPAPGDRFEIGSIIALDPPIPNSIDRPLFDFHQRYELVHEEIQSVLVHQTGVFRDQYGSSFVTLDLDCVTFSLSDANTERVREWLFSAHEVIENAFLASVEPQVLEDLRKGERRDDTNY